MKRFFAVSKLLLCMISVPSFVFAQTENEQKITIEESATVESRKGLIEFTDYVGYGINTLSVDGEHPYKKAGGMELAFGARYYLSSIFFTEGLIDFTNYRSYDLKDAKDMGYTFFHTDFYNFNVPVHIGAFISTTKNGGLCLYMGPTFCFNIYSKAKYHLTNVKGDKSSDIETETLHLGFDIGVMYNFGGAAIGLNYKMGVTELAKKTKESCLSFRLQYNIPLKNRSNNLAPSKFRKVSKK